jgi:hypothetical protein
MYPNRFTRPVSVCKEEVGKDQMEPGLTSPLEGIKWNLADPVLGQVMETTCQNNGLPVQEHSVKGHRSKVAARESRKSFSTDLTVRRHRGRRRKARSRPTKRLTRGARSVTRAIPPSLWTVCWVRGQRRRRRTWARSRGQPCNNRVVPSSFFATGKHMREMHM